MLSEKTSTRASVGITIYRSAGNVRPQRNQFTHNNSRWMVVKEGSAAVENKLVSGVLTIALGAIGLAWPGPSILVASTMFGVHLLASGFAQTISATA